MTFLSGEMSKDRKDKKMHLGIIVAAAAGSTLAVHSVSQLSGSSRSNTHLHTSLKKKLQWHCCGVSYKKSDPSACGRWANEHGNGKKSMALDKVCPECSCSFLHQLYIIASECYRLTVFKVQLFLQSVKHFFTADKNSESETKQMEEAWSHSQWN